MSDSTELAEQVHFAPAADGRDHCVNDGRDETLQNPEDNKNAVFKGVLQIFKRMASSNTEMTTETMRETRS